MEATSTAPLKFSRYRSVRHQNSKSEPKAEYEELPPHVPAHIDAPVKKVPLRYRRTTSRTNCQDTPTAHHPPRPQSPPKANGTQKTFALNDQSPSERQQVRSPKETGATVIQCSNTVQRERAQDAHTTTTKSKDRSNRSGSDAATGATALPRSYEAAREEARMILEGEYDRLEKLKQAQAESEVLNARRKRNTGRDERPTGKQQNPKLQSPPKEPIPPPPPTVAASPKAEAPAPSRQFRQLIIGAGAATANGPSNHQRQDSKPPEIISWPQVDAPRLHNHSSPPEPSVIPLPQIDAPNLSHHEPTYTSSSQTPNYDAPISAINATSRRVNLTYISSTISLPVTPTTTVRDLLNSASVVLSTPVDPQTAILLESFSQLGLERPLRRYERIRDVMNSWDNDTQNHLFILPASDCAAVGLELKDAPTSQPASTTVQMYHSSRPGKWTKQYLKLREDGQVVISRNDTFLETTNICHLSDFDLYTPTRKQTKSVKPPKKICFAVKSQQKSAMFLNGENYAHFFCTGRKEEADQWYAAVQGWRSWYLADVLGEGKKEKPVVQHGAKLSLDTGGRPSTSRSNDTVPYQLGSFKPLLDFGELRLRAEDERKEGNAAGRKGSVDIRRRPSVDVGGSGSVDMRRKPSIDMTNTSASPLRTGTRSGGPPSSFPKRLVADAVNLDPSVSTVDEDQAFTGKGLLARHASVKTQGGQVSGHGVKGKDGKPLVDLTAQSEFAHGSLLRQLEAWKKENGEEGARIDREKRREGDVKVGEGY